MTSFTVDEQVLRLSIYENIIIIDRTKVDALIEFKLSLYYIVRDFISLFSHICNPEFQREFLTFLSMALFALEKNLISLLNCC